jgi:hypothetical protein
VLRSDRSAENQAGGGAQSRSAAEKGPNLIPVFLKLKLVARRVVFSARAAKVPVVKLIDCSSKERLTMRQKPQGWKAVVDLGSTDPFRKIELPAGKAEREHVIAKWFLAALSTSKSTDLQILDLTQLAENDHDFEIRTERGLRFLELTEFAPLSGPYAEVSDMLNVGTTADQLLALINEKAAHYSQSGVPIILLIYPTHYAFEPLEYVFDLSEDRLRARPPMFEQVFFFFPTHPTGSEFRLMYPTQAAPLSQARIDHLRKKWFTNGDLTKEAWVSYE